MIKTIFSSRKNQALGEHVFFVTASTKFYPACQTDENGIKPGSNFHTADKRVADPSQHEYLGIKQSVFDV